MMLALMSLLELAALSPPPPPPPLTGESEYPLVVRRDGQVCIQELSDGSVKETCRRDLPRTDPALLLPSARLVQDRSEDTWTFDLVMADGTRLPESLERVAASPLAFEPAQRAITLRSLMVVSALTAIATALIGTALTFAFIGEPAPPVRPEVPVIIGAITSGTALLGWLGLNLAYEQNVRDAFERYQTDLRTRR
ncbi:MAG: hypothetical protein Q8S33_31325 [Myxococcales bacterium]|nr:hypothetical protein [Myxococcales bacterium]